MKQRLLKQAATLLRKYPKLMAVPYYTYRFLQPKFTVGVTGVVVNDVHEVLLVEHVFHPYHPVGLPGGWVGRNEDPAEALVRELQEELSLSVKICHVIHSQRTQYNHLDVAYLCKPTNTVGELSFELLSYQWHHFNQLPELHPFHRQAITHAMNHQSTASRRES